MGPPIFFVCSEALNKYPTNYGRLSQDNHTLDTSMNWCFTINHPDEERDYLDNPGNWNPDYFKYLVYQLEKGEDGTEHYQGYLMLNHSKPLKTMKNIFNERAHWERRMGTHDQARDYCMKEETRMDGPYEIGNNPIVRGASSNNGIEKLKLLIKERATTEKLWEEVPMMMLRYPKGITEWRRQTQGKRDWQTEAWVVWGDSQVGKSRWCRECFPGAYWKPKGKWWDGYNGEEVVIIDEYYGWLEYDAFCRLVDRYPLPVETKFGHVEFTAKLIIFTSNKHPYDWYNLDRMPLQGDAFKNRIKYWYCWKEPRCGLFSPEECTANFLGNIGYRGGVFQ